MDRRGPADGGPGRTRHRALRRLPEQPPLSGRSHAGKPRPALPDALAASAGGNRAPGAAQPAARAPRRPQRLLRRGCRVGARQLVRPRRRGARLSVRLGQAELVRLRAGRARRRAQRRRHSRHELLREVPGPGPRCGARAAAPLRQQRRRAGGQGRLHAASQQAGRDRGGPHRHAARRRPLSGGDLCGLPDPRPDLDRAQPERRRAGLSHRRDLGLRRARRDGPPCEDIA